MMKVNSISIPGVLLLSGLLLSVHTTWAAERKVSVPLDYHLIRNVLIKQLYTGEGETARVWKDGKDCSFLDLSNPQIGEEEGQIRIDNNIHARIGLQLGGKCIPAMEWKGSLQTLQKPVLDATGSILTFPVTRVTAADQRGQVLNVKELQDLINKAVQPKLANLKIDLNQTRGDIIQVLLPFIDPEQTETLQDTVNSVRFKQVKVTENALQVEIGFSGHKQKKAHSTAVEAFSTEELQQWQALWGGLGEHLERTLAHAALSSQSTEDKEALREVWQEANTAFTQGLTEANTGGQDPVRVFFNDSWDKLSPLLRSASQQIPGIDGLHYLTLIAATDIMYEVESITSPLGLDISSNSLRRIIRSYLQHQTAQK